MSTESILGYTVFPESFNIPKDVELFGEFEFYAEPNRCFIHCLDISGQDEDSHKRKVAEVEVLGQVAVIGDKYLTNRIHIVKELSWPDLFELCYKNYPLKMQIAVGEC